MTDSIDRAGRYYLRKPRGRTQFYVCWTDGGSPKRLSLKTAHEATARARFADFVVKKEHGERVMDADSTDWPEIVDGIVARQKVHARKRDLPFQIDAGYVLRLMSQSGFRCPVSGIPFTWSKDQVLGRGPWSPSIDRIDSKHGYVPGNIRVVCLAANIAMNAWGYDVLLRLANGVVGNHLYNREVVVGAAGIEPATPTMSTWCSTAELSAPNLPATTLSEVAIRSNSGT